jgi:hypothetical protein
VRGQVWDLTGFQGVFELFPDVRGGTIRIMDAGEGSVFFKRFGSDWIYVVKLEERTVRKLPHERFSYEPALPYRMALCPSLAQSGPVLISHQIPTCVALICE